MRKLLTLFTLAAAIISFTSVAAAQVNQTFPNRWVWASDFNYAIKGQQANVYTFFPASACLVPGGNGQFFPFKATTTPIYIKDAVSANSELVTPSAVSQTAGGCGVTISPGNSHYSYYLTSGTGGLQEALNQISSANSYATVVFLDRNWYTAAAAVGTPATIIGAATGNTKAMLVDVTQSPWVWYSWSGSAYVAASAPVGNFSTAGNGSSWTYFVKSELVTLATGAQTTDTTANLLPANSFIDVVQGVVNTTITGSCTGWELGDASTAGRFSANDTTLTAGEAVNGVVHATTGIASATTGMWQASAAKVRITCAGGNPSAGKIRVVVYGRTYTPPTS